jgi:3',5'-cyclic AMP phosphodiesterase CpdA
MIIAQLTDLHHMQEGELLYGIIDTYSRFQEAVDAVNTIHPKPDLVIVTGDLVEQPTKASYESLIKHMERFDLPVYVIPGNHDDPDLMKECFSGTKYYPTQNEWGSYSLDLGEINLIALDSVNNGHELPMFEDAQCQWLHDELVKNKKPTMIALHHPPIRTGIAFADLADPEWSKGLVETVSSHDHVKLIICGHIHTSLSSQIGNVPVFCWGSSAYELLSHPGVDVAPCFLDCAESPALHYWNGESFLSGPFSGILERQLKRIDELSGQSWDALKAEMLS